MNSIRNNRGIFMIIFSNIAFCAMVCLVRSANGLSAYTTSLFRFVIGLSILGSLALLGKVQLDFVNKRGHFFRGLLGGTAIYIGFLSIAKLGIMKSSVIVYTYPLFAIIFGAIVLKERIHRMQIVAMFVALMGVILICIKNISEVYTLFHSGIWEIVALTGACIGGLAVVMVKKLQATDSSVSIYFAQCLIGFWIVLVPAGSSTPNVGLEGALVLVGIGIFATIGQLFFTEGYRHVNVATGSMVTMLAPVLNIFAGAMLFKEQITLHLIIGSFLILLAAAAVLYTKSNLVPIKIQKAYREDLKFWARVVPIDKRNHWN